MSEKTGFHRKYQPLLIVGAGGVLGATSRFALAGNFSPSGGTLVINVLGSILLGFLLYSSEYFGYVSPETRMFFGTGFLGSFTTFSTFAVQTFQMPLAEASLNILENIILTLTGVFIGRGTAIYLGNLKENIFHFPLLSSVRFPDSRYISSRAYGVAGLSILILFPSITNEMIPAAGIFLVGAGGFAGAILRFLVSGAVPKIGRLPAGTLTVNVIGSFVLALLTFSFLSGPLVYFVSIGLLGSFTTFSTFAYESFRLGEEGETKYFLLNIVLNLAMCMAGIMTAYRLIAL